MKVKLYLPSAEKLIQTKGLGADGDVQMFHTQNVLNRIKKYMPYRTGFTQGLTTTQTDVRKPEIITETPYIEYLFRGKVKIDPQINAAGFMTPEGWRSRIGCVKVETDRDLKFNKRTGYEGPRWDKALVAREGAALSADLQDHINRRSK